MTAFVLLSYHRLPSRPDDEAAVRRSPANDDLGAAVGTMNGPEVALSVSFVGLNRAEQEKALASFPGARRCSIAAA